MTADPDAAYTIVTEAMQLRLAMEDISPNGWLHRFSREALESGDVARMKLALFEIQANLRMREFPRHQSPLSVNR